MCPLCLVKCGSSFCALPRFHLFREGFLQPWCFLVADKSLRPLYSCVPLNVDYQSTRDTVAVHKVLVTPGLRVPSGHTGSAMAVRTLSPRLIFAEQMNKWVTGCYSSGRLLFHYHRGTKTSLASLGSYPSLHTACFLNTNENLLSRMEKYKSLGWVWFLDSLNWALGESKLIQFWS